MGLYFGVYNGYGCLSKTPVNLNITPFTSVVIPIKNKDVIRIKHDFKSAYPTFMSWIYFVNDYNSKHEWVIQGKNDYIRNLDEVKFMNVKWNNYVMSSFRDEEWVIEIV